MRVDEARLRGWRAVAVAVVLLGGLVGLIMLTTRPEWTQRSIVAISGATTAGQLEVTVAHNRCGSTRVRLDESGSGPVRLRAEQDVRGDCEDIALETTFTVDLAAPLGNRRILIAHPAARRTDPVRCNIDGATGEPCG